MARGWTTEVKGEYVDFDFGMGQCQPVARDMTVDG